MRQKIYFLSSSFFLFLKNTLTQPFSGIKKKKEEKNETKREKKNHYKLVKILQLFSSVRII